jgi:hypothetical protein
MVLAAYFTPLGGRLGLVAQTVETVRFTPPERVDFRLVRGPVPHVVEAFVLTEQADGASTRLAYHGEFGADLWLLGQRWCALVAGRWEQTVAASLAAVKAEAERRASSVRGRRRSRPDRPPHPPADSRHRRPHSKIILARWRSAVDLGQARSSKRCRSHFQAKEATWRST